MDKPRPEDPVRSRERWFASSIWSSFNDFGNGVVEEVNYEKSCLRAAVLI